MCDVTIEGNWEEYSITLPFGAKNTKDFKVYEISQSKIKFENIIFTYFKNENCELIGNFKDRYFKIDLRGKSKDTMIWTFRILPHESTVIHLKRML